MKILIASDIHYGVNKTVNLDITEDYDVALLAGDIAVSDKEFEELFSTYFKNKKVLFVGGNHLYYPPNNLKTLQEVNTNLMEKYPLDSDISFLENNYKIIDNTVIIGCNLFTNYALKRPKQYKDKFVLVNGKKRYVDKKGNILPEDPTKTDEFLEKLESIKSANFSSEEYFIKIRELYDSVAPNAFETGEEFRERVSKEVFDKWYDWFVSQDKIAQKEYTKAEYVSANSRYAERSMNDFVYTNLLEIKDGNIITRKMTAQDHIKWFNQSKKYIDKIYNKFKDTDYNIIVMTHHVPSEKMLCRAYENSYLSAAFISDLDDFIIKHPRIKYWICGHQHSRKRCKVGNTEIIANPYGYQFYYEHLGFKPVYIEI